MDAFVNQTEEEYSCSIQESYLYSGSACLQNKPPTCCYDDYSPVKKGTAPDPTVLGVGYFMSVSLVPLVFSLLFGVDSKHAKVWARILGRQVAVVPVARHGPSSGA